MEDKEIVVTPEMIEDYKQKYPTCFENARGVLTDEGVVHFVVLCEETAPDEVYGNLLLFLLRDFLTKKAMEVLKDMAKDAMDDVRDVTPSIFKSKKNEA